MTYEFSDKTFILLVIFCIIWQKPVQEGEPWFKSDNMITGIRVFIASTIGVTMLSCETIIYQKNLYKYQTGALVSLFLIITLVVYMYSICSSYLEELIDDENLAKNQVD